MIWLTDAVTEDNWLLQRLDVNRHKGFIARRRADHVVSVDDGQLGLRRIWAISHDHLDYSRDFLRGRCRMARREGATEKKFSIVAQANGGLGDG
jgi:hypothetical protein